MTKPSDAQAMEDAAREYAQDFWTYENEHHIQEAFLAGWQAARAKQSVESVLQDLISLSTYKISYDPPAKPGKTLFDIIDRAKAILAQYKEGGK